MKTSSPQQREYRVIAAGVFKATCLHLLDEVHENRNLSILVTKRGKLIGELTGPGKGIKLSGPTIDVSETYIQPSLQARITEAFEDYRKKKKDKKKKHK